MTRLLPACLLARGTGVALALAFFAVACTSPPGESDRDAPLSGTVTVYGSSTLFPVAEAVAEEFQDRHPGVRVIVGYSGTGGGLQRLCRGEIEVATASRAMTSEEARLCRERGVAWTEFPVATDGVSLVVNPTADWVDCLSLAELRRIWRPESDVASWSQVRPGFPTVPLRLYGAGQSSGTFDHFTRVVVGRTGASRSDYQASEDDNVLVQGVLGDRGALGYFGHAYVVANRDRLKVLGVDSGAGCVTPTPSTIADGSYGPLIRPLVLYVRDEALGEPPVVAFMRELLRSAPEVVARTGYVPLDEGHYADLSARLPR